MIFALAAVTLVAVAAVAALADQLRRQTREQARERQLLISQVMHLSGRTWQQPPAAPVEAEPDPFEKMYQPVGMPDLFGPDE